MTIVEEAQRYLAVVDVFRAEGCEPHWLPEWATAPVISVPPRHTEQSPFEQTKKGRK
jgi:hypothetical protein